MRRILLLVLAALALGACGGSSPAVDESGVVTSADESTTGIEAPDTALPDTSAAREVAEAPEADAVDELDAEAVVAATLLIASGGDLEAAIDAGIIGEAEAEAALAALEAGSVAGVLD